MVLGHEEEDPKESDNFLIRELEDTCWCRPVQLAPEIARAHISDVGGAEHEVDKLQCAYVQSLSVAHIVVARRRQLDKRVHVVGDRISTAIKLHRLLGVHDGTLELERHNRSAERTTTEERKLMDAAQYFSHFCTVASTGQPIQLSGEELICVFTNQHRKLTVHQSDLPQGGGGAPN